MDPAQLLFMRLAQVIGLFQPVTGGRDPLGAAVMEKIDPRFPALMGDDYFSQDDFNIEQAAILEPELIVTSARTAWLESVAQLDIPVFLYDAETIDRLKKRCY